MYCDSYLQFDGPQGIYLKKVYLHKNGITTNYFENNTQITDTSNIHNIGKNDFWYRLGALGNTDRVLGSGAMVEITITAGKKLFIENGLIVGYQ